MGPIIRPLPLFTKAHAFSVVVIVLLRELLATAMPYFYVYVNTFDEF